LCSNGFSGIAEMAHVAFLSGMVRPESVATLSN